MVKTCQPFCFNSFKSLFFSQFVIDYFTFFGFHTFIYFIFNTAFSDLYFQEEPSLVDQVIQNAAAANKTLDRQYYRLRKKLFEKVYLLDERANTNGLFARIWFL